MSDSDRDPPRLDDERIQLLLDSYLAGDLPDADVAAIREWLAAQPGRLELLEDLRTIREVARAGKEHRSADDAWKSLLPILQLELTTHPRPDRGSSVRPLLRGLPSAASRISTRWRIAAAVLVVVGASSLATAMLMPHRSAAVSRAPSAPRHYATARGQRTEVRLADGSRVWLGPQTRLVAQAFTDATRDVQLDGEAYFDVAHDERSFTVRVHNATVQDLGTRFAIRAYALDTLVRVVVTQGKVRLSSDSSAESPGTLLRAGTVARVNTVGEISVQQHADTSRYLDFMEGQIVFEGTPLRDAVRELERWYDIHIQLAEPRMGDRRITATIADQALPDLLEQLGIALSVRVSRSGDFVVLSDKPTP